MSKWMLTVAAACMAAACSASALPGEELAPAAAPAALMSEDDLAGAPLAEGAALEAEAEIKLAALPDVRCDIRVRRTRHGVELEARARADAPAFGAYQFIITKTDAGGSSDIVQGGEFDLAAGEALSLGVSEFSVERGGRYRARLVLSDDVGEICRDEVRS
jgi:hypothetical protein